MAAGLGLLVVGAVVMYAGAEAAVRGSIRFVRAAGIPAFVLGALLFGIDLEGLGTAVAAAGRGETAIAAGETFGSVLFLFTAAFGVALLLSPRPVPAPSDAMLAAPAAGVAAAALVISDRFVARAEGLLLVGLYAAYVALVLLDGRLARERARDLQREAGIDPEPPGPEESFSTAETAPPDSGSPPEEGGGHRSAERGVAGNRSPALASAIAAVVGLAMLAAGALLLVSGGARLVALTGLSAGFVGAALLGALASLDEVLLEVLPIRRGEPALATGNLLGTLAAFTTGVLGIAAVVRPLVVDSAVGLAFLAVAVLYAVVATTFLVRGRAGRALGTLVLVLYAVWLAVTAGV